MTRLSSRPPDLADLAAEVSLRGRRGRARAGFRFLLDSRLFRLLCGPARTPPACAGFRASLERSGLAAPGCLPDLEMTPLAILDALGLEPPAFPSFNIPEKMGLTPVDLATLLVRMAKETFEKSPELRAESLSKRADEMREAIDPAAHELFDLCLARHLADETLPNRIHSHLALDALLTFRFADEVREELSQLFHATLLDNGESASGLSKVRLLKAFWDRSYERVLRRHPPQERSEVQAIDQAFKPRTTRDFLPWELLHYAVLGHPGERVRPVIAFVPDPGELLIARCRAHKTALRLFLDNLDPAELATLLKPRLDAWKPGWLIPCDSDGTFARAISTGELPIL